MTNPPPIKQDSLVHLYTLVLRPDDTYSILIDSVEASTGSLTTGFTPAVLPPTTIPDPAESKPADWVDEVQIPEPGAAKPEDWDESAPAMISDPDASRPEGWLVDAPSSVPDPDAT